VDVDDDLELVCLFCGEDLDEDARDFCQLDFTAAAGYGTFVCHAGCLRERAHDPDDFPDLAAPEGEDDLPPPDPALVAAWEDLIHVLGHVQDAELVDPAAVTALARSVEAAAAEHGVQIGHGHSEHD
jgi:hypothetical protein